ncbi:hypothetical protein [Pseudomonas fluorescens]|nr:hypothetical protein [Pseudomonas fluorescens]MDP9780624.1 hypothetical protein [Pseudomonas fluorescens]
MLIGYRFERTAQDDLHIHSRNRVQSIFVLLTGALAFILPVALGTGGGFICLSLFVLPVPGKGSSYHRLSYFQPNKPL